MKTYIKEIKMNLAFSKAPFISIFEVTEDDNGYNIKNKMVGIKKRKDIPYDNTVKLAVKKELEYNPELYTIGF